MNKFLFIFSEGLKGLFRARTSSVITLGTTAISLTLLGTVVVVMQNTHELISELRSRVILEAFVSDVAPAEAIPQIESEIRRMAGIDSVRYVPKDQALAFFRREFGDAYEDVLDDNPLPASLQIFLSPKYLQQDSVNIVLAALSGIPELEDVVYRGKILNTLNHYARIFTVITIVAGIAMSIFSFILIASNIRLSLLSRRRVLEIMQLVGATPAMVAGPFIVQGCLLGAGGALGAVALVLMGVKIPELALGLRMTIDSLALAALVGVGAVFGGFGSLRALLRIK